MGGRTLSSSSDVSVTPSSDELTRTITSVPYSPAGPEPPARNDDQESTRVSPMDSSTETTTSSTSSHQPISIEVSQGTVNKLSHASKPSYYTPPEPLSARGDSPGGYFPLHEDPAARVRRRRPKLSGLTSEPSLKAHNPTSGKGAHQPQPMTSGNTPVASYMPSGLYDNPMPMGKYYPSNYESRSNRQSPCPSMTVPTQSAYTSDSVTRPPALSPSDNEARRRMQQYQRDIVAQAAMVLESSANAKLPVPPHALPVRESHLGYGLHNPQAPKIQPLGSPGPVTPMDLESSPGSGYLERGRNTSDSSCKNSSPLSAAGKALAA